MTITVPKLSLVVLIGVSGSGKSTFARRLFLPTEIVSSDVCRGLVSDDENSQTATNDAFELLHHLVSIRLRRGLLTVVDATNVQLESRRALVQIAREHDVLPTAIVLRVPESVCHERNRARSDRQFGPHVIRNQAAQLRRSLRGLEREGFRKVIELSDPREIDNASLVREPLWNDRTHDHGPFDIIGDVHGCGDELRELLASLGYERTPDDSFVSPAGRKAIFVGDLTDRGPDAPGVLRIVMSMVRAGQAMCVMGNHDVKLLKKLNGRDVQVAHGLELTLAQLAAEPPAFSAEVRAFLDGLISHYVLDNGRLVVAHAGIKQQYIGRASRRVREFALYGDTTGEIDSAGHPVRLDWAAEYRGDATIVYGHTVVREPRWLNNTVNIDTGCVFGGRLTALRWPEREIVQVPARQVYAEGFPDLSTPIDALSAQQQNDALLDMADLLGKRIIQTELCGAVTVREENGIAAIEVISRFAADPRWLIYLPPTMSPCATSERPGLLEHPDEALGYFREEGVSQVICQEKHMGSRAVAIVCRDDSAATRRFGVIDAGIGIVYTRTGRRFFDDLQVEQSLLSIVRDAADRCGLWDELQTDWIALDCELMPWSAKAQELLQRQYAAVGASGRAAESATAEAIAEASARLSGEDRDAMDALAGRTTHRRASVDRFVDAYRRYCWPVRSIEDLRLAPFHVLASESGAHVDRDHRWHMQTIARLAGSAGSPVLMATSSVEVDLADPESCARAVQWWTDLTSAGGEGMVVKPIDFIVRNGRSLVQPAVKCRGPEYLRIIYGPDYDDPSNLGRLRRRGLGRKRSLAQREFALGIEGLRRFVAREPLRRVHECAFAVLSLESEPTDPRL